MVTLFPDCSCFFESIPKLSFNQKSLFCFWPRAVRLNLIFCCVPVVSHAQGELEFMQTVSTYISNLEDELAKAKAEIDILTQQNKRYSCLAIVSRFTKFIRNNP